MVVEETRVVVVTSVVVEAMVVVRLLWQPSTDRGSLVGPGAYRKLPITTHMLKARAKRPPRHTLCTPRRGVEKAIK